MAAVPPVPPVFTVRNAIAACGVDDVQVFQGETRAERIASNIFLNDFDSCMDLTITELDQHFKSYSDLTTLQGQIRLDPGVKLRIRAFIQWVRDEKRLGRDPSNVAFDPHDPPNRASSLLRRYKTHAQFIKKSESLASNAKPKPFDPKTKWTDWKPTFVNYLRLIPGRDGVPLSYVVRPNDAADPTPHPDFLDDYVAMAPLDGEGFTIDAAEVHTLLMNLIVGNEMAESKVQIHAQENNGRLDFKALTHHYEGVGVMAHDITGAEDTLEKLYYAGEKRPTMYWEKFERQLNDAFVIIDRHERRPCYSNAQRIRILLKKVRSTDLATSVASIRTELTKVPMTMTYPQAMTIFRNAVNAKFPPDVAGDGRQRRQVGEATSKRDKSKQKQSTTKRSRTDSEIITLTDGTKIEYHPSFKFPAGVFAKFKPEQKEKLKQQREAYKKSRKSSEVNSHQRELERQSREIRELRSLIQGQGTIISVPTTTTSTVSQLTTDASTIMGGRAEVKLRKNPDGSYSISAVHSRRSVKQVAMPHVTEAEPGAEAWNECDSNADTCVLGPNFKILHFSTRTADVYGYMESMGPTKNVPIGQGATAWDDPKSGLTFIIVINEGLCYGTSIDHSLIQPNQLRSFGVPVWDNPFDPSRGLSIELNNDLQVPLEMSGTKAQFKTRHPTEEELNTCEWIYVTSDLPWDPQTVKLQGVM